MDEFYDVTEIFEDLDAETIDLFNRKEFDIEDIYELISLKKNLQELKNQVDIKITEIYTQVVEDF